MVRSKNKMANTLTSGNNIVQERGTSSTDAVPEIPHETCDACNASGAAVAARYSAVKNESDLFFCAHHIRDYAEKLIAQGFTISPEDVSFAAGANQ